jgi:hypothetical protein
MTRMRVTRALVTGLVLAAVAGCAKPPPPDLDGVSSGAAALPLGEKRDDSLGCAAGDCADWYRVDVPANGELVVEIGRGPEGVALSGLEARLIDAQGETLDEAVGDSAERTRRMRATVNEGPALVSVAATDPKAQISYSIRATFKKAPPPRPPEPRFETRRAAVLEVEGRAGAQAFVLLDAGEGAQLRAGMRGKLVDGGKSLGSIVIQDVYPDGSRARIEGPLTGKIGPRTVAEIQVPVLPAAPGDSRPEP